VQLEEQLNLLNSKACINIAKTTMMVVAPV
jgi:hypothetical protein